MSRLTVGVAQLKGPGDRYRRATFVMGGTVRIEQGEWLEWVQVVRPVKISRNGLLLTIIPTAPAAWHVDPGMVTWGSLHFNRIRP